MNKNCDKNRRTIEIKKVCLDKFHLWEKIIMGTIKINDKNKIGK